MNARPVFTTSSALRLNPLYVILWPAFSAMSNNKVNRTYSMLPLCNQNIILEWILEILPFLKQGYLPRASWWRGAICTIDFTVVEVSIQRPPQCSSVSSVAHAEFCNRLLGQPSVFLPLSYPRFQLRQFQPSLLTSVAFKFVYGVCTVRTLYNTDCGVVFAS